MPSEQQLTKAIINMAVEAWHFKEAFELCNSCNCISSSLYCIT